MNGLEVMGGFQAPYMRILAESILVRDGLILNIGHGLALADNMIQEWGWSIREHHIVEINTNVYAAAEAWRVEQPHRDKIILHQSAEPFGSKIRVEPLHNKLLFARSTNKILMINRFPLRLGSLKL